MCHFMFWNDIEEPRWAIMGLVAKLAQSVSTYSFDKSFRVLISPLAWTA